MADELKDLSKRIKQLNDKASQMLLFLTFALVGAATVKQTPLPVNGMLVRSAMQWWVWAVFPVLVGVAPLKELGELFGWDKEWWYTRIKRIKVIVLLEAVLLSAWGTMRFVVALLDP